MNEKRIVVLNNLVAMSMDGKPGGCRLRKLEIGSRPIGRFFVEACIPVIGHECRLPFAKHFFCDFYASFPNGFSNETFCYAHRRFAGFVHHFQRIVFVFRVRENLEEHGARVFCER